MNYYIITGSSKGIGLAIVENLLKEDNNYVIGLSRSSEIAHERYKHYALDLSAIEDLKLELDKIFALPEKAEKITLINNAGTLGEVGYMGEISSDELPHIYNVNIIAPAILMNEFLRAFGKTEAEKLIVNISSGAGNYPVDGWSGYCATKSALNMLSGVISKEQEIRGSNVKIFSVAPGVVDTGMQEKIRNTDEQRFSGVEKFKNLKQNQALSTPELAAEKILKLIDNPNKFKDVSQDVRDI